MAQRAKACMPPDERVELPVYGTCLVRRPSEVRCGRGQRVSEEMAVPPLARIPASSRGI